jgi:hypothetical protein
MVITLPGVVPERYSLPGGTPVPVPAAPPIVVPASTPTPSAATPPAQAPRAEQRPARAPVRPAAVASPTPAPTATPGPIPKSPAAIVAPSPAAVTAPLPQAAQPGMPGWLWMLIGAIVTAALGGAAWALSRQRQDPEEQDEEALPLEEVVRPRVVPPARAPAPAPGILRSAPPPPPPVSRPQSDPFEIVVRPSRIELGPREVVLEFELMVGNIQSGSAEGIRVALATISASPDQDRMIAAFHRGPPMAAGGEPFDLGPGSGARIPARLSLPREHVHVVQVGGRPMFVAMLMIDLRWRSGLSICRFGSDFMIGTAGQGGKIGPIWLDRGPPAGPLGATRYLPREAAAA